MFLLNPDMPEVKFLSTMCKLYTSPVASFRNCILQFGNQNIKFGIRTKTLALNWMDSVGKYTLIMKSFQHNCLEVLQ